MFPQLSSSLLSVCQSCRSVLLFELQYTNRIKPVLWVNSHKIQECTGVPAGLCGVVTRYWFDSVYLTTTALLLFLSLSGVIGHDDHI